MTSNPRVRLTPEERREALLDLGVRLLADRSIDELSIEVLADEAGISRGLLYHYFGNKRDFHRAVVRRAADELIAVTAPVGERDLVTELLGSVGRYVDYVAANRAGYLSLVKGAAGGNEDLREIYEEARSALTERIFERSPAEDVAGARPVDAPLSRLLIRGWSALAEEMVLAWLQDERSVDRDELVAAITLALPALTDTLPAAEQPE